MNKKLQIVKTKDGKVFLRTRKQQNNRKIYLKKNNMIYVKTNDGISCISDKNKSSNEKRLIKIGTRKIRRK